MRPSHISAISLLGLALMVLASAPQSAQAKHPHPGHHRRAHAKHPHQVQQAAAPAAEPTGLPGPAPVGHLGKKPGPDAAARATAVYTPVPWPNIAFGDYSGELGAKVVALTFDDGPDLNGTHTAAILDVLRARQVPASFFVCGHLGTDVRTDKAARAVLKRIADEGHDLGSHTFSHPHVDKLTPAQVVEQFEHNERAVQDVLGQDFAFSTYRIPYGFPFQTNHTVTPTVGPLTAPYGVHIGWGIDTDDWKCSQDGKGEACLLRNLQARIEEGHSGPILMHSVYALTAQTLPRIIDALQQAGYRFVTTEQMVQDKYGVPSREIVRANKIAQFSTDEIARAAAMECAKNQAIQIEY